MSALVSSLAFLMLQEGGDEGGGAAAAVGGGVGAIIGLVIAVIMIAAMWKLFTKAGEPGWAAIIPIYNFIVLLKIAGRPLWWIILFLIPFVNIVVFILVCIDIARKFGKGAGYGIGLAILGVIFFPLLAFGDAQYNPAA
jgi:uncharacterized membrane protein YhaH (DUF805 family)